MDGAENGDVVDPMTGRVIDRHMSVDQAAAALGLPKATLRHRFDRAGDAAGWRDRRGHRRISAAWVQLQLERLQAEQVPPDVATWPSVAEVCAVLGRKPTIVRRWFDQDQPASGTVLPSGRTASTERRFNPAWVAAKKAALDAATAAPTASR